MTEPSIPARIGDPLAKTFEPGEVIFREGDEAESEAYLVHEGMVEAQRRVDGEEQVFEDFRQGRLTW